MHNLPPATSMEIKLAITADELEAIYQFRYQIYVTEMNRKQKYADHEKKRICDPLDPSSYVFGAWKHGELIGTVRTNFIREADVGEYHDFYQIGRLSQSERDQASLTTRLMIHSEHRRGTLGVRLAQAIYTFGLERGITADLIDCNSHLVPFFTGLGHRPHREDLDHPEYGSVTVLKLDLTDEPHLEETNSPFLPILRKWIYNQKITNITN